MVLTEKHKIAAQLLSTGVTVAATAKKVDVAAETVSRWRSDYDFQAEVNSLLVEAKAVTTERLRALTVAALDCVEAVMLDDLAPPKDRLTAAFKVIELCKVSPKQIGSTNPARLRLDDEQQKALESCGF